MRESMNGISIIRKPALYGNAIGFIALVPGCILVALRGNEALLLPRSIIELIFPLTVLPFEPALISILLEWNPRLGVLATNGAQPSIFVQQIFAVSFVAMLSAVLILTVQALADALNPEVFQQTILGFLKGLLVSELIRIGLISMLLVDQKTVGMTVPSARLVSHFLVWIAPLGLPLVSSLIGVSVWSFVLTTACPCAISMWRSLRAYWRW